MSTSIVYYVDLNCALSHSASKAFDAWHSSLAATKGGDVEVWIMMMMMMMMMIIIIIIIIIVIIIIFIPSVSMFPREVWKN